MTVAQGRQVAKGLIEWVFGAGALAFTPVGRDNRGVFFEHRVSWYAASARPGMTLGHDPQRPADAQAALGVRPRATTIMRCFNCHASGVRPGPNFDWMEPGVQCERCHGPGRAHASSAAKIDIQANRATTPDEDVTFCAQCHRFPEKSLGDEPEKSDPMLVRFAPVGLVVSRCFRASGRLMCSTCHDPHANAPTEPAFYGAKCRSCHDQPKHAAGTFGDDECLSCHMPKRTPVADLTFTDHRIRILGEEER